MSFVFRNDDITNNSRFDDITRIYKIIKDKFPDSEIYSCITILSKYNKEGMPYPPTDIPISNRNFYDVDNSFDKFEIPLYFNLYNIISHGLFHCYYRGLSYETQKMSIVSSCNYLNTKIFIPPFWAWDKTTEQVCKDNDIHLWVEPDWKNIELVPFDPNHQYWLFHSWKWNSETFYKAINK